MKPSTWIPRPRPVGKSRRVSRSALCLALVGACFACGSPPGPTATPAPTAADAIKPVVVLTRGAAIKVAFELAGWTEEPTSQIVSSRLTTWAEAPAIASESDRAPSSGDHPVWFIGLSVGASPSGGASFVVILDAVDGHAIQTRRAIS